MGLFSRRTSKCVSQVRLDGKTAIVTGSNTGIGKITAKEFYKIGARVILACRDVQKAEEAVKDIRESVKTEEVNSEKKESVGELVVKKLDLSSFESIKKCAKDILQTEERIYLLVNNAGVMACPKSKTEDGFELQFGTNHLGHFLFTCLLLPRIIQSAPARIVTVSSMAHSYGAIHFDDLNLENGYGPVKAYAQSKLANILFTKELANRLKGTGVSAYALHPGIVKTEIGRNLDSAFFPGIRSLAKVAMYFTGITPEEGAKTTIYCSLNENLANESGEYYTNCAKQTPSRAALDAETAKKLWEVSVKLTKLENWDPFTAPPNEIPPMLQNI